MADMDVDMPEAPAPVVRAKGKAKDSSDGKKRFEVKKVSGGILEDQASAGLFAFYSGMLLHCGPGVRSIRRGWT